MAAITDNPKLQPKPQNRNQSQILDLLADIKRASETAAFLGQDVHEEYFEAYHADEEQDRAFICYDYDRHRVKMSVVMSAIEEIASAINAIHVLVMAESYESASTGGDEA